MPQLPPEWAAHLESGTSHRVGGCHADGRPEICRALASRALPDGCIELVLDRRVSGELMAALDESGRLAYVASQPDTNRTLHVKGTDARVIPVTQAHMDILARSRDRFIRRVEPFGFRPETIIGFWFEVGIEHLVGIRFTPSGAWDQSPGPGAGQVVELLPVSAPGRSEALIPEPCKGEGTSVSRPMHSAAEAPTLRQVRRLLEGVIPPAMCTVAVDGMPHVSYLSHAEFVDDDHVALTYQFFNRTRNNLLATGRAALMVEDPVTGVGVVLHLRHVRTETAGPIFERLRAKLAGIAAHTGMEKVFHLRGADVCQVESLRKIDASRPMPAVAPRCDLAVGVRRLSERMAEANDLSSLVQAFCDGLSRELRIDHAIVWMLDEPRLNLYTLASIGYEHSGSGAELAVADTGLVGIAVRENVPIRIGHMSTMVSYGLSWRTKVEQLGLQATLTEAIPLPGLLQPRSQLAVPLRARGRMVGALLVESENDQFFSYDDEDALTAVGAALALGLATLPAADASDDTAPSPAPRGTGFEAPAKGHGPPRMLRLRHFPRDHSVFVGEDYIIRGVAGAILAKVVRDRIATGSEFFTTRELRLAADELRLPDVQDNLGVRLLLLERRLSEGDFGLRIERAGRGRYRLLADAPLQING